MINNKELQYKLEAKILNKHPEVEIKYKEDYWYWKILPKSLQKYGSQLGTTIWLPNRKAKPKILAHEYIHYLDKKRLGDFTFLLFYLMPQCISVIYFLLLFSFLITGVNDLYTIIPMIVFLLPWPSKTRLMLETRGYMMNLAIELWTKGAIDDEYIKKVIDYTKSWTYYKMVWSPLRASTNIQDTLHQQIDTLHLQNGYKDVYEIINEQKTILPAAGSIRERSTIKQS
jgi:hypothetical protein